MKHRNAEPPARIMGRPLKGDERLDVQLTFKVSRSMADAIRARGDVGDFLRRAAAKALAAGRRAKVVRKGPVRRKKTKHRV